MSRDYSEIIFINFLQFFADGGASGGDGGGEGTGAAGENAADAGRDSLEALGVPREYAQRHRQRAEKRGKAVTTPAQNNTQPPQNAEAPAANEDGNSSEWDAFFSRQENKDRLQQMMADRGKAATEARRAADQKMEKLGPVLRLMGEKYNIAPDKDGNYDIDAISKAVTEDDSYYEEKALELGVSTEVARKLEQAEALEKQREAEQARAQRQQMLQEHFDKVRSQAKSLEELVPGFSLENAMQDPEFVRRTAPGMIPADEAYVGLHYREILKQQAETIARLSKRQAAASVAAGSARPRENGSAATASVTAAPDLHAMTQKERRAYMMAKYPPKR